MCVFKKYLQISHSLEEQQNTSTSNLILPYASPWVNSAACLSCLWYGLASFAAGLQFLSCVLLIVDDCQTIFTLLARVSRQKAKDLDTKWYQMEHEGELFRARLLWADSINVWTGNDSIFCDHYRLDIDSTENKIKILDQTDYFSENITQSNLIKQLWVEKSGEKKIIQASAQISGLAMKAIINLE